MHLLVNNAQIVEAMSALRETFGGPGGIVDEGIHEGNIAVADLPMPSVPKAAGLAMATATAAGDATTPFNLSQVSQDLRATVLLQVSLAVMAAQ